MTVSQIGIKLSLDGAKAVQSGLDDVNNKLGSLDSSSLKVGDAFARLGSAGAGLASSLKGALLGLAGAFGFAQLTREFVDMADTMALLGARLQLVTGGGDNFVRSQKAIYEIAQANNVGLQETTTLYTKLLGAVQRMGGGVEENTAIVRAFSSALRVGGANTQEAASATLQFAQAMASGVLRGEEFNAINEASPRVMEALAKGMGAPIGQLRQMAQDGKLTADVVGNALISQLSALSAEAAQMPDTVGGAFQRIKNDVALLVSELNEAQGITLGLADAMGTFGALVIDLAQAFRVWGSATKSTSSDLDGVAVAIRVVGTVMEALIVLSSDVVFVFKAVGREIGGIIAQFSAMGEAGGIFTKEGRAAWTQVGQMMRDDAAAAREELDRFQKSVLGATNRVLQQRDALKNHSLSAAENTNELTRLGNAHGVVSTKTLQSAGATKEVKQVVDQAAKAGQDYLATLNLQFAAMNQQISLGRELTKSESEILKLEEEVRTGKKKLTEAELESARAKLQDIEAMREQIAQKERAEKATLAVIAAQEKEYLALVQSTEKLQDELAAQEAANLTAQTGVDVTAQLTVAKLRDAAATADRNALIAMERQENDVLAEQYRKQAAGLRALADAKEQGIHIKAAQEANAEWQKVTDSINNGLTDALMRAFESGKGFFAAFKSTLVNAFKSLVLQPTIRAILAPVSAGIGSIFGFGNAMASTGAGSDAGGGLGSLLGAGANLLNGGLGNMLGLNLVNSGLGQALGLSSVQNIGGNMIAGPTGLGNMAASGLGMLGNGMMGYGISSALSGGYSAGSWVNAAAGIASAIPGIGPIAGVIGGLVNRAFGMKAKELKDAGITGTFTAGGVNAQQYQDWFQKGGWFRSNKSGTDLSALGSETSDALKAGAFGVLSNARAWASALALPGEVLSSVTTQFKVKLTGKADEDQAEIGRLFERYSNDLAGTYQAQLRPFQRAGEALGATLQRLAGLQQFSVAINDFGGVFSRVASLSVDAKEQLIGFAGGIEALLGKTRAFVGSYYSEAEQAGLAARAVQQQLRALGINNDLSTRADFRSLVEGTDVSNEQGRQRLAALLDIANAFAPVGQYLEAQGGTLSSVAAQAPAAAVLQSLLSGPGSAQQATVDGLSELTVTTAAAGDATVSALERLITRVGQLESALVGALDRNARTVSDSFVLER